MRLVSITIESSSTKNLGNYQSAKASVAFTVSLDLPFDSHSFEEEVETVFETLNYATEAQLRQQLIHAQRAIFAENISTESLEG